MRRIWRFLITGRWALPPECQHHWVKVKEIAKYEYPSAPMPYKTIHILQCKHCGDMKRFCAS